MRVHLGIDGGGTSTKAICVDEHGTVLAETTVGPANARLASDAELAERFASIAASMPQPSAICAGLAGVRSDADQARVAAIAKRIWPDTPLRVTHDLEIALAGAVQTAQTKVLILSGTGSCCYARNSAGQSAKAGGWGHLLGDRGSGYDLSLQCLRHLIYGYDLEHTWPEVGSRVLQHLALNNPEDLIDWASAAAKAEIAEVAPVFFAHLREPWIAKVMQSGAHALSAQAACCATGLKARDSVLFVFAGSVFQKQPSYVAECENALRAKFPKAEFEVLSQPAALGACKLAAEIESDASIKSLEPQPQIVYSPVGSRAQSPTELRNPRSATFSEMGTPDAVALMIAEEGSIPDSLRRVQGEIVRAVDLIAKALSAGGRLFYVGAGTSGRLGALDASECPPTFRSDPEMVQGIIAGGQRAFWRAVEGAEDNLDGGRDAMRSRGVRGGDVVAGIAASGRTPFVWGAMEEAKKRGAATVFLCFNPHIDIPPELQPNVLIAANLGPEVLTGSTRLKAGTATKIVLNIFSTIAMARLGKVMGNLMIDLNPSNLKLRDRAVRIVQELTGRSGSEAREALEQRGWVVKDAVALLGGTKLGPQP
ncbi:MAG TPA: N-acetylmuramic acid 6-phosphate etherase [Methylomirabilota bacterium]|nr:N-acetylmuramic acid 6-phosphate etherase [Methylomirabilota bacterium]